MAASPPEPVRAPAATTAADPSPGIAPAPTKPAPGPEVAETTPERPEPAVPRPLERPVPGGTQIEVADGLVAIEVPAGPDRGAALGSIAFGPDSAALSPEAKAWLQQILGATDAEAARVKVVGEGAAPALALDRARAVGVALVEYGLPADRLEMTLAEDAAGDRARLFLAVP
jgi:outer membrane protein OmpA-like peptidoglycan-associated protein